MLTTGSGFDLPSRFSLGLTAGWDISDELESNNVVKTRG